MMNSFGNLFRISLFGESHGDRVGVLIDGCPAGISLSESDFSRDLERRKGIVKGTTRRKESDRPSIQSGVYNHRTTGAPISILFENENIRPRDYSSHKTLPRPGHTDFVAHQKFGGFHDFRGGGHFSGRLTVGLVAAGVVAKKMISPAEAETEILEVGGSSEIEEMIDLIVEEKDSFGGIIECKVRKLPVGLGEPFFDTVESLLSHLVFAIPGIKGIEFGSGFACSRMKGSACNDEFIDKKGKTRTNHSGGINGGITNGNEVIFRVAVKPTPSIKKEQKTINLLTGKNEKMIIKGRHDVCFALRMPVIIEAAAASVFADLLLQSQVIPKVWKEEK